MSYRINWYENGHLIGTELSEERTLQAVKSRAREFVAADIADCAEVVRPNGEVAYKCSKRLRKERPG
jgi:hypothetical protein